MDVCYINIRKTFTERTPLLPSVRVLDSSSLFSEEPRTVTAVGTSLFSASVIYIINLPITQTYFL
jgi:hypothetical protein